MDSFDFDGSTFGTPTMFGGEIPCKDKSETLICVHLLVWLEKFKRINFIKKKNLISHDLTS